MVPDWLSIQFANVLVLAGLGLLWLGARQFNGRRPRAALIAVAPLIWLAACAVPVILADINARSVIASSLAAGLAFAAAAEVWRGRAEPLLSRWPTVITLTAYGSVMLARVPLTLMLPQPTGAYQLTASALYPFVSFGTLLFAVILAFLLLNMTKERSELRHKTAALVDSLTGVANRRAFLAGAQQLAAQPRSDGSVLAMLLFDLDHFKAINDRLGHAAGDAVLMNFSATAIHTLGEGALFGRIGGEEFGAVLRVKDAGEARAIAEEVRAAFAAAEQADDVVPTVSIGVALQDETAATLSALMAAADRALYRAKAKGRNRVVSAASGLADDADVLGWHRLPASA
jgi:diguanylate cyclase (GGDEF)-like protein